MTLKPKQATNNLRGSQMSGGQTPPGWTDTQANTARQIMVEFMSRGASAAGAAGYVGNTFQESSIDPNAPGGGLSQWIGSRWGALQSFASSIGAPVNSTEAQVRFAIHEMTTGYPQLWNMLKTTKDPRAAALAISQQYERPGIPNNQRRQDAAAAAYQYLAGGINAKAVANIYQGASGDSSGGGGGGGGPTSILDLLTSPVDTLGGWLAKIAFNLLKDTAIAIGDDLIIPFWHWNQRAVDNYMTDLQGNEVLWTATFWGFGYALLFTDPESGSLAPAPVRRSRIGRHVRRAQSVPARMSLVKPKDVERKTPKKPKPRISTAAVSQTGTMRAIRNAPVRVTGSHVRSEVPVSNPEDVPLSARSQRDVDDYNRIWEEEEERTRRGNIRRRVRSDMRRERE